MIGNHVTWKKLEGKADASMTEGYGFGVLMKLEEGRSMLIVGDYGILTSYVKHIEDTSEGLKVITRNSTYLVKRA